MALELHFHNGEIAKFAEVFLENFASGFRGVAQLAQDKLTTEGKLKKVERRKYEAMGKLESIALHLDEKQKSQFEETFNEYVSFFDSRCVERSLTRDYRHIQRCKISKVSSGDGSRYLPEKKERTCTTILKFRGAL